MNHHRYSTWGVGHMSYPDDPTECCYLPEDHPIHRPKYWREGEPVVWPRTTWVCDGCKRAVTRDQIADMCDGEHVLCSGCLRRNRGGAA